MSAPMILGFRAWLADWVAEQDHGYSTPCWVWLRARTSNGYGVLWHNKSLTRIHRLAYQTAVGPIGEGLELDHLCRVRACCNPDHLEAVTHAENMRRVKWKRTVCLYGHPMGDDNIKTFANGARRCLTCYREYHHVREARRAALRSVAA